MKPYLQNGIRLVAVIAIALGLLAGATTVQAETVVCDDPCNSAALAAAIAKAAAGDVIEVPAGTFTLAANVTVNKDVTIRGAGVGAGGTIFEVSGTGTRLTLNTAGASLENFEIYKTDKTAQSPIIAMAANNLTLSHISVHGQWQQGDGETVHALTTNAGITGVLIEDSSFYNVRQPGYLNGGQMIIRNTHVATTRGWVVDGPNVTFTGNTWGTGAQINAVDIAILAATNAAYYPDILALSADNNDAVIEDQRAKVMTHVWVDDSSSAIKDAGYRIAPNPSLQAGINQTAPGGKLFVAEGTYQEAGTAEADLTINRSIHVIGAGKDLSIARFTGGKKYGLLVNPANALTPATVSISGMGFMPHPSSASPENGIAFGTTAGSFAQISIDSVSVERSAVANLWLADSSTYGDVRLLDSEFTYSAGYGIDLSSMIQSLTVADSMIGYNGNPRVGIGGGLYMAYANIQEAEIRGNDFDANTPVGLFIGQMHNAAIHGNIIHGMPEAYEVGALMIYVPPSGSVSDVFITNNQIINNAMNGFVMYGDGTSTVSNVTFTSNLFKDNQYTAMGIYTGPTYSGVNIHHNIVLTLPDRYALYNAFSGHNIIFEDNWLGCNEGPNQPGCGKVEGVAQPTWLVLEATAASDELLPYGSTAFTASLKKNNKGIDRSSVGSLPDGSEVSFNADLGTFKPSYTTLVNDIAQTTYTASYEDDTDLLCAVLDNEEVCTGVTVLNVSPVAAGDSYTMNQHAVLTVDAPGVLANDTDVNENALTAYVVKSPDNGELDFNEDGSFTYTPKAFWFGEDTFTYRANDNLLDSQEVTVTITVENIFVNFQILPLIIFQP